MGWHARRDAGERFFEEICEGATDLIFSADAHGRLGYANPAMIDALALGRSARAPLSLFDAAHPDSRSRVRDAFAAVLANREPSHLDAVFVARDGSHVPVDGWLDARLAPDGSVVVRGILRDVAREEQARFEIDRLFALSKDMLCVAGTDGFFKRVNPAFEEVLGYDASELLERPFIEFVHPEDRDDTLREVSRLAEGQPTIDFHNRYHAKDGAWRWLQWRATPIADRGLIYAIARDATEQVHLQKRLERQTKELARSNDDLEQFAAVASHDLQAPLRHAAQLVSWIEKDMQGELPGPVARHLEALREKLERMERLTSDLLSYARADLRGEKQVLVDTRALVDDVVRVLSPPDSFEVRVEGEMPRLRTQREALEQVFRNLIGNAIGHHDRESGAIVVGAGRGSELVSFTVTDDGPGIPPGERERVFDMFRTGGQGSGGSGSGLGLAVVKKLVEGRGGSVTVESAGQRGTRFRFTWPELPRDDS